MPDYNFLNLSPAEFEELVRDLLQKHLGLNLESFTSGRDKGIDLRYSTQKGKNDIIIQCKRYKEFNSLYNKLKEEVPKVHQLNPERYILATSVGLTPNQKGQIISLFQPYIKVESDIFGKDDFNNLLGQFPEIEKLHFKLWLASTNILERIIHSKTYNQSTFEETKVKETIKLYVENESYHKALDIIKSKKYVIVSGIPGIGKTTLARILVYHFLANGFDEFIFLSDSISEGYEVFKENTKQIFLFDDFLGRNFLDKKLSNNEEQRIIKFIEKISNSNDKILILTTREYILTQAKLRYDIFDNPSLEFAKCVIDISDYTSIVRAKILYNHLFFSNLQEEYIGNILENGNYEKIIQHRNYNPRVIEVITNPDIWKNINPGEFSENFINFLDYPESIWKHVFENQISGLSQCILANLLSAGTPILMEDLKSLVQNFAKNNSAKYKISFSELDFKKSIRELENTFIHISKDKVNQFAVEYQNPSVQDFLVNYFKNLPDYLADIIKAAIYFNQLFTVFALEGLYKIRGETVQRKNRIILDVKLKKTLIEKLLSDFDYLNSSVINRHSYLSLYASQYTRKSFSDYTKLSEIAKNIMLDEDKEVRAFALERFKKVINPTDIEDSDFGDYIDLLAIFKDQCVFNKVEILKSYSSNIYFLEQTSDFERFENLFPDEYQYFIENDNDFASNISSIMLEVADDASNEFLEDTISEIKSIGKKFGLPYDDIAEKLEIKMQEYNSNQENGYDWNEDDRFEGGYNKLESEKEIIRNMFDSLRTESH